MAHAPTGTSTVLNPEAPASEGTRLAEGLTPSRDRLPAPVEALGSPLASGVNLLILGTYYYGEITAELLAFDEIISVDLFQLGGDTPTLTELQPYDAVILANDYYVYNPSLLGDVLADYLDQGGRLIQAMASYYSR